MDDLDKICIAEDILKGACDHLKLELEEYYNLDEKGLEKVMEISDRLEEYQGQIEYLEFRKKKLKEELGIEH